MQYRVLQQKKINGVVRHFGDTLGPKDLEGVSPRSIQAMLGAAYIEPISAGSKGMAIDQSLFNRVDTLEQKIDQLMGMVAQMGNKTEPANAADDAGTDGTSVSINDIAKGSVVDFTDDDGYEHTGDVYMVRQKDNKVFIKSHHDGEKYNVHIDRVVVVH